MNFFKKINNKNNVKILLVVFVLLIVVFHTNKNIFNCLNCFDKNLKNNNVERFINVDISELNNTINSDGVIIPEDINIEVSADINLDDETINSIKQEMSKRMNDPNNNTDIIEIGEENEVNEVDEEINDIENTIIDGNNIKNKNIKNTNHINTNDFENNNMTSLNEQNIINEQNINMEDLVNNLLKNLLESSKNEIDKKYGNFSDIYMKLLNNKMKSINSQNKDLKLDLSNLLSLRESNHRRQVFLEVLLFNLVSKYKSLVNELKKCNKENVDSNEQLKQTLYINQLLQNKIQEITNEKENAINESKVLNNIGKNYKYIKVGPKMYKELERLNLHKNIPNDMKENIKKGLIHVLKV